MSDLRTIPAIRAEAELLARDAFNAEKAHADRHGAGDHWAYRGGYDGRVGESKTWAVEAHLDLLCDLTRPASRDAVARLVAAKIGIECGAMAPDLARFVCGEHCCDGEHGRMVSCSRPIWSMMGADETQMVTFADCPDPDEWDGDERRHVPGVSTITDPAEALRLIATHVLRSPDV